MFWPKISDTKGASVTKIIGRLLCSSLFYVPKEVDKIIISYVINGADNVEFYLPTIIIIGRSRDSHNPARPVSVHTLPPTVYHPNIQSEACQSKG